MLSFPSADLSDLTPSRPPPRLFCDICDIFDAHDTDDCPIQEQDDEGPPPTHYHEDRHTDRPYCDTCEGDFIYDYCFSTLIVIVSALSPPPIICYSMFLHVYLLN